MTQATVRALDVQAAGGLEKWMRKPAVKQGDRALPTGDRSSPVAAIPQAKGRTPADAEIGYAAERMNRLEAKYAGWLEAQRRAGKILFWRYESLKFRLADRTWYTPDFYIMRADGCVELHETKGFWEDDARVKIKVTAEQFPELLFVAVQWDRKIKDWAFEHFGRRPDGQPR